MARGTTDHPEGDRSERLPLAVVRGIAERTGADPTDLDRPLADVVDPEALGRLFAPQEGSADPAGYVVFRYEGFEVMVDADGGVEVFESSEWDPAVPEVPDGPELTGPVDD